MLISDIIDIQHRVSLGLYSHILVKTIKVEASIVMSRNRCTYKVIVSPINVNAGITPIAGSLG